MALAWLAFDAYVIRKDFVTASKGIGFGFLAVWYTFHAFHFEGDLFNYLGYVFYFGGLIFILLNLFKEAPVDRPKFEAVLVLPSLGATAYSLNLVAAVGLALISIIAFRQYKKEFKKALFPFIIGFASLTAGAILSVFYDPDRIGGLFVLGHVFEVLGFFSLGWWVWSYLQLRIREELLLILVSLTLVMAVVVGLTFSAILVDNIESLTRASLSANVKVLNLEVSGLKEEALAKVELLARRDDLAKALVANDFVELEQLSGEYMKEKKLGFLSVLDKDGRVVLRAHALTRKDDDLSGEAVVSRALRGISGVDSGSSPAEGFSVRSASPLFSDGQVIGALVGGFQLDNAFVDSLKKLTGLNASIFDNETIVATTILNSDRRSRSTGLIETNRDVIEAVLKNRKEITISNQIGSRSYLVSYLPVLDANGQAVGMISIAKAQNEILDTVNKTNRLTFVTSAIILLVLVMPLWFVTRRLTREI